MSNLRPRHQNQAWGGSDYDDLDDFYPTPKKETRVETPLVDETEQGVDDETPSLNEPSRPRSIALAVVAANAVHAAWESGYALGFNAGRLAGLNQAVELGNPDFKPTYPPDGNPF